MQMNRFVLLFLIEFVRLALCEVEENSDAVLDLIRSSGYKGKRYQVETEDGYLLMVHRMSSKTNLPAKHPALLLHGLFATSADYVLTGPKSALAYLLADNGYDVWLGNARGNNYSANHKTLPPESGDFWNFSWHEIGFYDLPATVDFILNETKSSKVFYVGHSQGSTSFLVFLSTHPEYNDKLAQAHLLAPAAFMKNEKFPKLLRVLGDEVANGLLSDYKFLNLAAYWDLGEKLSEYFCIEQHTKLCEKTYFVVFGANQNGIKVDNRTIRSILRYISPRVSVMQVEHFNQLIRSGKFQWFDYQQDNMKHYKTKTPPEYELANVKAPIYLYSGLEDSVVSKYGVEHLKEVLPNVIRYESIPDFNHGDFTYANNSRKILYQKILRSFEAINETRV